MEYSIHKEALQNDLLAETLQALDGCYRQLGSEVYVVGAAARDIALRLLEVANAPRRTMDLDVAVILQDWSQCERLSSILLQNHFEKAREKHERLVTMFFDYIEHQIEDKKAFNMTQFAESVDKLLTFNDYKVLHGLGSISAADAKQYAEAIYDEFNKTQNIESDFDRIVKLTKK